MTWTQFMSSLAGIYLIYYSLNLLTDFLKMRKARPEYPDGEELFFEDEVEPELVILGEEKPASDPPTAQQALNTATPEGAGGVGIRQLFELAKSDLIEYTKAIPY